MNPTPLAPEAVRHRPTLLAALFLAMKPESNETMVANTNDVVGKPLDLANLGDAVSYEKIVESPNFSLVVTTTPMDETKALLAFDERTDEHQSATFASLAANNASRYAYLVDKNKRTVTELNVGLPPVVEFQFVELPNGTPILHAVDTSGRIYNGEINEGNATWKLERDAQVAGMLTVPSGNGIQVLIANDSGIEIDGQQMSGIDGPIRQILAGSTNFRTAYAVAPDGSVYEVNIDQRTATRKGTQAPAVTYDRYFWGPSLGLIGIKLDGQQMSAGKIEFADEAIEAGADERAQA